MKRTALVATIVAGASLAPASGRACKFAGAVPHVADEALRATDTTPPTLSPTIAYEVNRGTGMGGCAASDCDGIATIDVIPEATDDMSAPGGIGYRLSLAAGQLPTGLGLPTEAIKPGPAFPRLPLFWSSDASGDEAIDFTLRLVAVDAAGNESPPQTVRVYDDPGGCAIARRGAPSRGAAFVAIALALLARRPRRRSPAP
jgi:hypothetical protein